MIFSKKSGKGGARKKNFESKSKKSLAQLFYIGHTMYVNTKISWIRALGAEIIDFVDDGIFGHFASLNHPKPTGVI